MGFRFRKSFKLGPFRFTASKSGISSSFGVKGFRVTKRADGKTQTTVSIPGTGLSHVYTHGSSQKAVSARPCVGWIAEEEKPNPYEFLYFYLKNTREKNADGQKRQDILYLYKMRRPPFEHLVELSLLSDSDTMQIAIGGAVVGDVPEKYVEQLRSEMDRLDAVTAIGVEGRRGEYEARVVVRLKADPPDQAGRS